MVGLRGLNPLAGFFGSLRHRFPSGHKKWHDLQHQTFESNIPASPGFENSGCQFALDPRVKSSTVKMANVASRPKVITSWKIRGLDAAVIDEDDERGQPQADGEPRRVDRGAGDRVQLVAVERWKDARQEIAGRDGLPGADDRVQQTIVQPAKKLANGGTPPRCKRFRRRRRGCATNRP